MHRSRLGGLIIDCQAEDPQAAAEFWSAALGLDRERPGGAKYVTLARERGLHIEVQAVSHESRVHLDIETDDIPAEVARLEGLGARRLTAAGDWVVMEAPTGQRFCVVPAEGPGFAEGATAWEGGR